VGGAAGGVGQGPVAARALAAVEAALRRHALLAGGETIVIGVSGGGDSVALLYLLASLAASWRLSLHVLHVDHQLRAGSSAEGDVVRRVAAELGVPAEVVKVRVAPGGSPEAAARHARYRALSECADRVGAHRIALGHTADDQAETVLMRLLEGAGVRGLAGIPVARGRIIRPLLGARRDTLRALLDEVGLAWIEDPSNGDRRFLRNRVRHDLLPLLERTYNPAIAEALARVARLARAAAAALEHAASAALARTARVGPGEVVIPLADLRALPAEIAAEVLRQGVMRLGGEGPLRAWAHRGLRRALAVPLPRRPVALGGVTLEVSAGCLRLASGAPPTLTTRAVPVPGSLVLPEAGLRLETAIGPRDEFAISADRWQVVFDADLLAGPLLVRARRRGDRMTPFGATEPRRVKGLLREAGVPRWERDRIPLLQAGADVVWLGGIRRAALAPVSPATRRVLQISAAHL
jgi:tRNA(Ile)-lysidine synthase